MWLHSTGDQFHKFWQLYNTEEGSLAGSAEGECWRHTKQRDPNELENPRPSRGLSRCYRHEKRYCFIELRLPSLSLTRGKDYYLTIKTSLATWSVKMFLNRFDLWCSCSTPHMRQDSFIFSPLYTVHLIGTLRLTDALGEWRSSTWWEEITEKPFTRDPNHFKLKPVPHRVLLKMYWH